jgi:hypothetical protein
VVAAALVDSVTKFAGIDGKRPSRFYRPSTRAGLNSVFNTGFPMLRPKKDRIGTIGTCNAGCMLADVVACSCNTLKIRYKYLALKLRLRFEHATDFLSLWRVLIGAARFLNGPA